MMRPETRARLEAELQGKMDPLVVLGKNIGVDWTPERVRNQRFNLSPHSRINVLAAGIIYKAGLTGKIIFSTGHTSGKNVPSEAEAMKRQLLRIFPSIPDEDVLLEEESLDTWTNASKFKRIQKDKGYKNMGLLTVGFHLKRAEYLFERAGVDIDWVFKSDEILEESRQTFVENYRKGELVRRETEREKAGLRLQRFPLSPQLLSIVTRISRNPNKA